MCESVEPQSNSLIMMSCTESTRRRVKCPASAVLRAVSDLPLRPPCVAMKNSKIVKPSFRDDLIGNSMVLPEGLATFPFIPQSWVIWLQLPLAPEFTM